ncbi:TIGR01841 family phasin [Burkholderia sp. WSM2230]|uniref:TIGR01841 family phasin n=1 Tax=Burkholderia sp. WSM2230 TaxID=944435 RepID=UPI00040040AD|nr:TIGR01841 family phasin [Burkholderia sp. WSM2230]
MALLSPEQFAASQKANLDAFFALTGKVFEGVEKLVALNVQAIKSTLVESQENMAKAPVATDPQQWFAPQAGSSAAFAEKSLSYSRQFFDIASTTQAEVAQLALAQYERYNARLQEFIEEAAKSAPAGSEAAIAAWKSAISATTTLCESLQKTGQQAVEMAGTNLEAVTTSASRTARRSAAESVPVVSGAKH